MNFNAWWLQHLFEYMLHNFRLYLWPYLLLGKLLHLQPYLPIQLAKKATMDTRRHFKCRHATILPIVELILSQLLSGCIGSFGRVSSDALSAVSFHASEEEEFTTSNRTIQTLK
jgi:hypothetical protein